MKFRSLAAYFINLANLSWIDFLSTEVELPFNFQLASLSFG